MQRENEPFLLRRRPAIGTPPVKRNRGEGEQVFVGEELGGWVWYKRISHCNIGT
jgi:hypothetical protein